MNRSIRCLFLRSGITVVGGIDANLILPTDLTKYNGNPHYILAMIVVVDDIDLYVFKAEVNPTV